MNSDITVGQELAQEDKRMSYRTFAKRWQDEADWNRFDYEDGEIDMLRAFLIAVHGYTSAGGHVDFSDVPDDEE